MTMTDTEETHRIKMRPRAGIIGLIGEGLISDEEAALVELVKNAYDADASEVTIIFHDSVEHLTTIEIEDDGCGMTANEIQSGWFEPGASKKRKLGKSDEGRVLLGEKGIGRFAAAKLGRFLTVKTKSNKNDGEIEIKIDWNKFKSEKYLDSIDLYYNKKDGSLSNVGTTLIIEGIKGDVWNKHKYDELTNRLSGLISPNFIGDAKGFKIKICKSSYSNPDIVKTPSFFEDPKYLCEGEVIKDNDEYRIAGSIMVNDFEKKQQTEKLEGVVDADKCGIFEFKITAWDRDKESLDIMTIEENNLSAKQVREMLNVYCGVRIYRDGFRIFPYGGQGNDWLSLDNRNRQNPTMRLANNQVIGSILITNDCNEDLVDRSSREGLKHNVAYRQLVEIIRDKIMPKIEHRRYNFRRSKPYQHKHQVFAEAKKSIKNELAKINSLLESAKNKKKFNASKIIINEDIKQIQNMFSRLMPIAGLGLAARIMFHEIGAPIGGIADTKSLLEDSLTRDMKDCYNDECRHDFNKMEEYIISLIKIHDACKNSFRNFGNPIKFTVSEKIKASFNFYNTVITSQEIKLEYKKNSIQIYMDPTALLHILFNLLENAIYWVSEKSKTGVGGKIKIEVEEKHDGCYITIFDNGMGIPDDERNNIFKIGFSKKSNGTGLGLYICQELIGNYGTVKISRKFNPLGGAAFEIFVKHKNTGESNE